MELFKLLGKIAIDNTEANSAIDDTTNKAKDGSKETSSAFEKIGGAASKIAVGIGTAGLAMGGAFVAAVEGTRDYRKEMGLLESAFLTQGHTADEAKKTYSELNSVLGDSGQAVEAAQHIALISDNEKEMQTWTNICTGVVSKFGASLPVEGLTEAANHTAQLGEVQGSLADALEWSGITVDDFNEQLAKCSTEQERQDLIMNTLNDTYKDASNQYKETNKDVIDAEKANEQLADAFAELGTIGEPILTKIKEKVAEMIAIAVPKIQEFIDKIKDCVKWIKENESTIKTWAAVILGASITIGSFLLVLNWGSIMAGASKAIQGVTLAVKAFNLALKSNPIGLVISIIAGLVAAIIYLWNTNENFRQFWINAWEKIKEVCKAAWEGIKNAWNGASEWFSNIWRIIKSTASELWSSVKKFFSDAWAAIKVVWNAAISFFSGIWNGIKSVFSSVGSWIGGQFKWAWDMVKTSWNAYKTFFTGIWNGIKDIFSSVGTWFRNTFNNAWNNIKAVFSGWGNFFGGLWNTIKDKFTSIGTSISNAVGTSVKKGINGVIGGAESLINGFIDQINGAIKWINKIPGVDISKIAKVSFTRLAEGGVLEKGQMGFLEGSGAEAVVPLENNTQWIKRVAEQFNNELSNNTSITGQVMIERINKVISLLEQLIERNIYLDTGVLVGELTPSIDSKLGEKHKHILRGNTI